jgi:hypothetical protein
MELIRHKHRFGNLGVKERPGRSPEQCKYAVVPQRHCGTSVFTCPEAKNHPNLLPNPSGLISYRPSCVPINCLTQLATHPLLAFPATSVMASLENKKESNIVHSTPKRRRSANYASLISRPSSQSPDSIDITHQEMAGLAAIVDVDVEHFMEHLMPGFEAIHDNLNKQSTLVKGVQKRFLNVPNKHESYMYDPLVSQWCVS